MRNRVVYREDLTRISSCSDPACGANHKFQLTGMCHKGAPTINTYDPVEGTITFACAVCEKFVACVSVARQPTSTSVQPLADATAN